MPLRFYADFCRTVTAKEVLRIHLNSLRNLHAKVPLMDGGSRSYFYSREFEADNVRYVKPKRLYLLSPHIVRIWVRANAFQLCLN